MFTTKEANNALQTRLSHVSDVGRVPTSLADGTEVIGVATEPEEDYHPSSLMLERLADGKVCFLKKVLVSGVETNGLSSINVEDEDPSYLLGDIRSTPYVVEAFPSLRELPPRPTYVPEAGSKLADLTVVGNRMVKLAGSKRRGSDGKTYQGSYDGREWTFRMCGPAPRVTADTHYITVVHRISGADDDQTKLYVWEITDEPYPHELR